MADDILVAIGANLPDRRGRPALDTCRWAVSRLAALPGLRLVARSRWFRTAPVPASAQPDYVNGAVRLSGAVEPHAMLGLLHAIEAEAGRTRAAANDARTLDLDLLAMDGLLVGDAVLTLPHPRLHCRGFVLAPLCDVASAWRHPVLHRTVAEMLGEVDLGGVAVAVAEG